MELTFRRNAVMTAAFVALASAGTQAQEANAWDVAEIIGGHGSAITALSRAQVVADLAEARADGSFHAGNEGSTPPGVLARRAAANERQAERIAQAYREEAERVARASAASGSSRSDVATWPVASSAAPATSAASGQADGNALPASTTETAGTAPEERGRMPGEPSPQPRHDLAAERRGPNDGVPGEPDRGHAGTLPLATDGRASRGGLASSDPLPDVRGATGPDARAEEAMASERAESLQTQPEPTAEGTTTPNSLGSQPLAAGQEARRSGSPSEAPTTPWGQQPPAPVVDVQPTPVR